MATETAESAGGMPQLDIGTFPNQIFWLLVALIAIYFLMSRIALPRIANVLAERQGAIQRDLDAAEDMKQKAVEAEEAYNKALADARAEAQRIAAVTTIPQINTLVQVWNGFLALAVLMWIGSLSYFAPARRPDVRYPVTCTLNSGTCHT